jgi:hypothetical protein
MSTDIWELNDFSNMKVEKFENSFIFYMDNFYKYPDLVLKEILSKEPPVWKEFDKNTFNMIHFEDRRHMIKYDSLINVYEKLGSFIEKNDPGRGKSQDSGRLVTNHTLFYKNNFNDYKTCWWWPHVDSGYNGIVYLNYDSDNEIGTNLYREAIYDPLHDALPEHKRPWIDKSYWTRIASFKSSFNRFVMFDGAKYYHGMNIDSDRYFNEFRINQVFFFN